jgi:hypothetical protein
VIIPILIIVGFIALFLYIDDFDEIGLSLVSGLFFGFVISIFLTIGAHAYADISNNSATVTKGEIVRIEFVGDNAVVETTDDKVVLIDYEVQLDDCEMNTLIQREERPEFMPWLPEFGVLDDSNVICIDVNDYVGSNELK